MKKQDGNEPYRDLWRWYELYSHSESSCSFSQNYHQLPEVLMVQPKPGTIWSFKRFHQLPEVPLVQPKISNIWSFSPK